MPTPPALVTPGNLYVDLATRTLWLGVDVSEDPAGAVLISDIVDTTAEIVAAIATSAAYTDAQVATRAPSVHTHVHGEITDFTAAVLAVVSGSPAAAVPLGIIAMYSGSLATIGVGDYANWKLCDGTGGTPDLRDKFILGAGNVATGSTNPAAAAATNSAGDHTPVILSTTLTLAQVPAHAHTFSGTGTFSGSTSSAGSHTHTVNMGFTNNSFNIGGGGPPTSFSNNSGADLVASTSAAGSHSHTFTDTVTISGSTGTAGSGGSHTHGASAVPAHSHTITSADLRAAIPYYALAFIMKVS